MIIPVYTYRVDAGDRIKWVSPEWLAFARENDAAQLTAEAVVGRPLLDFVSDAETRHLYQLILTRVRQTGNRISLPFRCDGPAVRRFMELNITPLMTGELELVGRLVLEEEREWVELLDAATPRGGGPIVLCGWCKRVDVAGRWLEVEQAVARMRLFERSPLPEISHALCTDCDAVVRSKLGALH